MTLLGKQINPNTLIQEDFETQNVYIVAKLQNINLLSAGTYTMYVPPVTVPTTGLIVVGLVVMVNEADNVSAAPAVQLNSTAGTIFAERTLSYLMQAGKYHALWSYNNGPDPAPNNASYYVAQGDTVSLQVTSGGTGTTLVGTAYLCGVRVEE